MKRYIAVFLCLITLIPLLALPASAKVIMDGVYGIDVGNFLVGREPISGTNLWKYVYKFHADRHVRYDYSVDSIVAGNTGSISGLASESHGKMRVGIPYCFAPKGAKIYFDALKGNELIDVCTVVPGSIVTFTFPWELSFTASSSISFGFVFEAHLYNDLGSDVIVPYQDLISYNSYTGVTGTSTSYLTSFDPGNYSGYFTLTFVMPEDVDYLFPEMRLEFTALNKDFSVSFTGLDCLMEVETIPLAESPSFSCNWNADKPINYELSATANPLVVEVNDVGWGTYSYQWYLGEFVDFDSTHPYGYGSLITGATSRAYTPSTRSVGTHSFYCIVKHTSGNSVVYSATPMAKVVITAPDPDPPSVSNPNQPSYEYTWSSDPIELVYFPTVSDGGTLSYQWFVGTEPHVGNPISGATSSTFLPSTDKTGTYYYWCEITNDNGYSSVTVKSETTAVTVTKPSIDDVTYSWSMSPMEFEKGSLHTFHLNVPAGLYESVTYQWYKVHDLIYTEAIPGETSSSFVVPTDEVGVYQYLCLLTGKDGSNLVRTQFKTGSVIVVDELTTWPGFDDFTGISWNWSDDPIRLEQNSFHLLQVNVPASYGDVTVQWYSKVEGENYVSIPGETDLIFDVPTDELGAVSYVCAIVFDDGTGFSRRADVIVVESDNYNAGTGGSGSSGSTNIDHSDYFKPTQKNNLDLVEWAVDAYESGWGYVMGTYGQILTQDLFNYKLNQYPEAVSPYSGFIQSHWLNKRTADCVGLIKGYCWYDPATGSIEYATNDTPDYSADQMYDWCVEKGPMSTMPEIPGLLLWKQGHVGIYIGNGYVIEARGTTHGVIKSKIDNLAWTNWAKIPSLNYINSQITDDPEDDNDDDAALGGIWQSIKNLPNAILDGIKGLFVPDAEAISAYQNQWQDLMSARFGAIYQSVSIIDEFARSISEADQQNTIHFPAVSVDLAGEPFEFGGWDVQIVPEGFDFLIDTLKRIISIIATLGFVNAMRNKFEKILGG